MIQWGIDTVYQENYFGLLNATEMGRVLTYLPTKIGILSGQFGGYVQAGVEEVIAFIWIRMNDYQLLCFNRSRT